MNIQTLMNFYFYEKMKNDVDFEIANMAFLNKGILIKADYISHLTKFFKSGVESISFRNSSRSSETINDYVNKTTNGLVNKIVNSVSLSDLTR